MNISGIRIQAGFYDYNTIKNTQIQEESVPNAIDTAGEDKMCIRDSQFLQYPVSLKKWIWFLL